MVRIVRRLWQGVLSEPGLEDVTLRGLIACRFEGILYSAEGIHGVCATETCGNRGEIAGQMGEMVSALAGAVRDDLLEQARGVRDL